MILLLELFTNEDYPEQADNRMMYVFICPKGHSAKVLRCQTAELQDTHQSCAVCNFKASSACGSCSTVFYCSKKHQSLDWKLMHKLECGSPEESVNPNRNPLALPEFEICCEPEPDAVIASIEALSLGGEPLNMIAEEDLAEDEDFDEPETESGVDKAFLKFQKRVEREPEQILR